MKVMVSTPEILAYFGLTESFIRNQAKLIEKYEKIKVNKRLLFVLSLNFGTQFKFIHKIFRFYYLFHVKFLNNFKFENYSKMTN